MKNKLFLYLVILSCLSLSGCAILKLPFQILGGLWQIIQKMLPRSDGKADHRGCGYQAANGESHCHGYRFSVI